MTPKTRCAWAESDPIMRDYHDREWGIPLRDSRALWELLMLEGFQAGLSWRTILHRRDTFRTAFANFDPEAVARFTPAEMCIRDRAGALRPQLRRLARAGGASG